MNLLEFAAQNAREQARIDGLADVAGMLAAASDDLRAANERAEIRAQILELEDLRKMIGRREIYDGIFHMFPREVSFIEMRIDLEIRRLEAALNPQPAPAEAATDVAPDMTFNRGSGVVWQGD